MDFGLDFINGASVGFEYSKGQSEEEYENTFLIDLFIIRVLFQWPSELEEIEEEN